VSKIFNRIAALLDSEQYCFIDVNSNQEIALHFNRERRQLGV